MPLSGKVFFSAPFNRALLPSPRSAPLVSDLTLSWANTRSIAWADLSQEGTDNLCAGAELTTSWVPWRYPQLQLSSLSRQALLGASTDRAYPEQPWPHNNLPLPAPGNQHQWIKLTILSDNMNSLLLISLSTLQTTVPKPHKVSLLLPGGASDERLFGILTLGKICETGRRCRDRHKVLPQCQSTAEVHTTWQLG